MHAQNIYYVPILCDNVDRLHGIRRFLECIYAQDHCLFNLGCVYVLFSQTGKLRLTLEATCQEEERVAFLLQNTSLSTGFPYVCNVLGHNKTEKLSSSEVLSVTGKPGCSLGH